MHYFLILNIDVSQSNIFEDDFDNGGYPGQPPICGFVKQCGFRWPSAIIRSQNGLISSSGVPGRIQLIAGSSVLENAGGCFDTDSGEYPGHPPIGGFV